MLLTDTATKQVYWALSSNAAAALQQVDAATGLSEQEALARLSRYGENRITYAKDVHPLVVLAHQFTSPFIILLIAAAGISFAFKEWLDGLAILIVMVINAAVGYWMEMQAQRSMEALRKMGAVNARVIRNGQLTEMAAELIVPGDLLFVEGGEMIAADVRLLRTAQLQTDESALTGESLPVEKTSHKISADVPLAERNNMLYKGTFVTRGNGLGVVVYTGMNTELGIVTKMVEQATQAATPLEKKIQQLSKRLIWITLVLITLIFIIGILYGNSIVNMLETSIALAVAAIPEGLPVVSTLALSFGMLRMARHNVIVKKLSSVETLGNTNVICTDKTGTLTRNDIAVSLVQIAGQEAVVNIDPAGSSIRYNSDPAIAHTTAFAHLSRIAALCNNATYQRSESEGSASGDPLEVSLLKMVYAASQDPAACNKQFVRIDEVPFTSESRIMGTLHEHSTGYYVAVKGAAEDVLTYCTTMLDENGDSALLTTAAKTSWQQLAEQHALSGLRVLAFAYRETINREKEWFAHLTLAGLIGFIDPPRMDVQAAIEECKKAGIRVVMITGDHPATARHIAIQLGIITDNGAVITGRSMKPYVQLTAADKEQWLNTHVFARVSPEQKLDLVTLLQEKNLIVGMTGDGVNDAPALKKADIGIAMGQRGTQVAQEVADMVLKDDAFSSIVVAVKQGRVIFDNIRRFVVYLLSCNLSELLVITVVAILNLPFQLLPLQILFINLVTDVLPALALGVTGGSAHIMHRKPYPAHTLIIDRKRWAAIFTYSAVIAIASLGAVSAGHLLFHNTAGLHTMEYNNLLFFTLIFSQLFHVFNMSFNKEVPFYRTAVFRNRYVWYAVASGIIICLLVTVIAPLSAVLDVTIRRWQDWSIVFISSLLTVIIIQVLKKRKWVI